MTNVIKSKGISTFALVLLIASAIDSVRNLPATALFGSSLVFFFIFAAIVLLLPAALVSAELASTYITEGGIYPWVTKAFGQKIGFFAIWLQWVNTVVWYPTILSFAAGILAYLINPALAHNRLFLISVILIVFWGLTFLNLFGLKVATWFTSCCAIFGMIIPMILIMVLGVVWVCTAEPLHIHFSAATLLPNLGDKNNWISLTAIMTAFLGMELATVHVRSVNNPRKSFPRALFFAVLIILITMLGGSLAIAAVLPAKHIQLVSGVMQAFTSFFKAYHMHWLLPLIAVMLFVGSLGEMVNWIISPAKGLLQAGQQGYLPKFLLRENKKGVASSVLIAQAILVTFVCLAFLLMPSVNGSYWLLTDLSTQLYVIMYLFMFAAAISLKLKSPIVKEAFHIPGGKLGFAVVSIIGFLGALTTVVVGFFPPAMINVGGFMHYETMFVGGLIVMCLPVLFFYYFKSKQEVN